MRKWIDYLVIFTIMFSLIYCGDINVYAKENTSTAVKYYAYEQLPKDEQTVYQEIYRALLSMKDEVQVSTLDTEILNKVFQCVMNDHPEIFYAKGYEATQYMVQNKVNKIMFHAIYTMNRSEVRQNKKKIAKYVQDCLTGISADAKEYDKICYFYEYIIKNTEYNTHAENSQNICSVMINGESVCQGYAKTFQYLCQKSGIMATMITGYANQEGHAWNLVYVEDKPYYVDVTWGDASYIVTEEDNYDGPVPPITYDYLLVTTDMLKRTHRIDNVVDVPECVSMEQNYFVKENLFFSSYDEQKLKDIFEHAVKNGEQYVTLKCNGGAVYKIMKEHLLDKQEVFLMLPEANRTVAFSQNELQYTLSFIM